MHKKRILKFFRNTVSVALALSMLISNIGTDLSTVHAQGATQAVEAESEAVVAEEAVNSAGDYGLADNIQDGVILHCFDWKYNDIKAELKNIAEAGFTSVQTSPAQRADGYGSVHEWYYLYQPQGFTISSNALGTKEELKALCDEAHKYGIKVIVDVIGNHTCGMEGHNGPIEDNVKRSEFFRWNNKSSSEMSSDDWKNRYLVTHCNVGMRDLVTENTELQDIVAGYLAELKSIGVDGIRWDTAKHIGLPSEDGSQFWPKMAAQGLYQYGEILEGPSDDTNTDESKRLMKEYTDYMSVTDNNYGSRLCGAFRDGKVPADSGVWTTKGISSNKLVYWAESHDTYANDEGEGGWTKYIDQNKIDRAYAIAASRADATALYYSRPLQTAKTAIKAGEKGSTHFTATEVAEVNKFHNNAVGERDYYVAGSDAAAVCRESGAVIVKASGSGNVSVANGGGLTKPGTYKDRISGAEWTVTSSTISGSVGASGIAVIYEESSSKPSVSASMTDGSSFTTDTQAVTFTVSNATSATYSIDGGAATSFTNSVKLTLGENTAFGSNVTVKITATNAEGTTEKTFTYTKKEAGKLEKNTVYFTKPSGWSSAKIYAYIPGDSATKLTGAWPGTAMTDEGNGVYSYTFDASVSECKVIFTDGTNQTPKDEPGKDCGHDYVSGKAYTCENEVWTAVEISNPTTPPTNTPVPTVTEAPVGIKINSSLADNSSFSTETETIKITLENAEKGTYCVDDGPVK
ncbi:MAG: starch-binding protein, partial [Lachnospiraceae bacterium]|nr:starch-binding protein [Lachnospiraceae bacterium]